MRKLPVPAAKQIFPTRKTKSDLIFNWSSSEEIGKVIID
ncbi:hypothetical protein SALWKB12_1733 [Snodgrassella communis]|nr:hypothetical protein SALWKB12_1733 [Snodgrassella communis]